MNNTIVYLLVLMQIEIFVGAALIFGIRYKRSTIKRSSFIDTSVLIDGRIVEAIQAGFVPDKLVIPRSVLSELQLLADGADREKRSRARNGLDIAAKLNGEYPEQVSIFNDGAYDGVDNQLLKLARKYHGSICTIDYNLNKVATVEGIRVLNINELAKQLRIAHLPGERVHIKILQKGNDASQGVGYMPDGTMVVVEQAAQSIGKEVEVEFIRSLQTAAGRMLFARVLRTKQSQASQKSRIDQRNKHGQTRPRKATAEDKLVHLANNS